MFSTGLLKSATIPPVDPTGPLPVFKAKGPVDPTGPASEVTAPLAEKAFEAEKEVVVVEAAGVGSSE